MRKVLFLLLVVTLKLSSCLMYSVDGRLVIKNFSKDTIYFSYSGSDSLQERPEISLMPQLIHKEIDGVKKTDSFYGNRILALDSNRVLFNMDAESSINEFPERRLYVFIVKVGTLRNHTWDEITGRQLYDKRYSFTVDELKKMNWVIKYP